MERVNRMVAQKPVVIFSKTSCCMCHTIKSLFNDLGVNVNAAIVEVDEDPNRRDLERALGRKGCNPVVPAVFIGGQLMGGANEIMTLHLDGSLVPMLKQVGVIWL